MKRIVLAAAALVAVGGSAIVATSASGPALPKLTLAMDGSSITVGGSLQSGAVDVVSTTTRVKDASPVLVRLNPGVTPDQLLAFAGTKAGQDLDNIPRYGTIVFNAAAPRGTSTVQTSLQAGQYLAVDTTSNKPPIQQPHAAFTVTAAAQPASLPKPAATVSAIDFGFTGQKTLRSGSTVRFVNRGHLAHMLVLMKLAPGTKPGDVITLLRNGKGDAAQKLVTDFFQGAGPITPGSSQQLKLTAKPGTYLSICFLETQAGQDHPSLNMMRVIRVAK